MEFIIKSSQEAFLHTGTMIGFFILLFSLINYYTDDKFVDIIQSKRKAQPIIGALIGAIPGCGGSLALVPLYIKNKISFGTIVASLIGSMGDASFLLISSNIRMYIFVISICITTGIITGILVDRLKLEKSLKIGRYKKSSLINLNYSMVKRNRDIHYLTNEPKIKYKGFYNFTHKSGYKIYIFVLILGFVIMTVSHLGGDAHSHDAHAHAHSHGIFDIHTLEMLISLIGILLSIILTFSFKSHSNHGGCNHNHECRKNLKEVLIHSVEEITFVICWIFIAYLIYEGVILSIGGEEQLVNFILQNGVLSVFIGALLGIVPGCGVQIILMSFYLNGAIPLGALIANAISQDGDALFPLIAMDKKSSFWATIITTIPAIIVGVFVYYFVG